MNFPYRSILAMAFAWTLLVLPLSCKNSGGKNPAPGSETSAPATSGTENDGSTGVAADDESEEAASEEEQEPAPNTFRFGDVVEFDKVIHDFGDILESDGPQKCSFKAKNVSNKPIAIYQVISSCGCTDVNWTREPIKSGQTGTITATFKNEDGPYPFDKTLTVYVSDVKKPIILRIRGIVYEKKVSLEETYQIRFGDLAMRSIDLKAGNLSQGEQLSDEVSVANLGKSPLKVTFTDISAHLQVSVDPDPIPARGTAKLHFNVISDRSVWGKNYYYATPLVDGARYKSLFAKGVSSGAAEADGKQVSVGGGDPNPLLSEGHSVIGVWAFTKENFSSWSDDQKDKGSEPIFTQSTYSFGSVKAGTGIDATFTFTNQGKSAFKTYKIDSDSRHTTLPSTLPAADPGKTGSFTVHLDTKGMSAGETLVIITLTTNSPLRPLVNLFLTGYIK